MQSIGVMLFSPCEEVILFAQANSGHKEDHKEMHNMYKSKRPDANFDKLSKFPKLEPEKLPMRWTFSLVLTKAKDLRF